MIRNLYVFEGTDGAGKSCLSASVNKAIADRGNKSVRYSCPGLTNWGVQARDLLREDWMLTEWDDPDFLIGQLSLLDYHHGVGKVNGVMSICKDSIVLLDRYFPSTIAYAEPWENLRTPMTQGLLHSSQTLQMPNKIFYLVLEPEEAIRRLGLQPQFKLDKYDTKERLKVVNARFRKVFNIIKGWTTVIALDATKSIETLTNEVLDEIYS